MKSGAHKILKGEEKIQETGGKRQEASRKGEKQKKDKGKRIKVGGAGRRRGKPCRSDKATGRIRRLWTR